ncbi:NUDIX hydrolase [Arcobacter roscoffensis]|uniref:NUDIX domain-containing protein n=1 Tax=Arcobacter roscoffensis TaxID=2961520 RepID=A0ABY5E1M8_9BACT|nr:NUDIX domain-containing protein [Arcobacter roscoffensis]UTJ06107.1 NUDIX domain-containing protein [Arcobacter roscoffensis]
MNNSSVEKIACFTTVLDPYNGITIDAKDLPNSKEEFELNLDFLIEETINKRNLIWIYIDIKRSDFIPITTKKGFFFHSCDEDYILVVKRLKENAIVPTSANHTLGVGAVVINDKKELLVIKEKISTIGFKLPGGHIDNCEMISTACVREVLEETGIHVEFESIISLGHFYPHQFHKSNLYVLCLAKPLSFEINIQDTEEIVDAKWVKIEEYLEDETVLAYSKAVVMASLEYQGFKLANHQTLCHIKRDFELFFPIER